MHNLKKKDQSTITLSSEELAACRKKLEHRWKNRTVDAMLLERAWQTAYQIAAMLYDEFPAKHVAVFGIAYRACRIQGIIRYRYRCLGAHGQRTYKSKR